MSAGSLEELKSNMDWGSIPHAPRHVPRVRVVYDCLFEKREKRKSGLAETVLADGTKG